ncbi:hypothetical protein V8C86DRAFT_2486216 [Haematococcus lacustris]
MLVWLPRQLGITALQQVQLAQLTGLWVQALEEARPFWLTTLTQECGDPQGHQSHQCEREKWRHQEVHRHTGCRGVRGPAPVHSGDTTSSDWQVMDLEEMEGRVEALLANGKKQSFLPVYESVAARLSANQRKQLVWFHKLGTAVSKLRTTSLGVI